MFKVLLVDDEEEVRKGIRDRIDWTGYNLEVAGEAENGMEALEFFDEDIPDIVITDINMPFMNGLELAEKIKDSYPTVKVVLLTGFDDFKFAQTAIKFGVSDYILKPVLPKDINELLEKLENELLSEINEKTDIENLRHYYKNSLPVIRENYLMSLVLGKKSMGGEELISEQDAGLEGNWFSASICKIDSESVRGTDISREELKHKRFSVFTNINEILDKHGNGGAFLYDDGIVILLASADKERKAAGNAMIERLEEIRMAVERYTALTVSIGMGRIVGDRNEIRNSYLSALTARKYKTILSGNKVIFVEDLEPGLGSFFHLDEKKEDNLISSIKFGDIEKVGQSVESLFCGLGDVNKSMREYQLYFIEIISSLMKLARLFEINYPEVIPEGTDMLMEFDRFNSLEQAGDWIRAISENLMNAIADKRRDESQILYEKAMHYLNENFGDSELSVQKLSEFLYISPSYLNLILKKKSGKTFLKNLVAIRLEKAKEMLSTENSRIAEVAEAVGYPDISYFSYFFKKKTGKSPREYKKTVGG